MSEHAEPSLKRLEPIGALSIERAASLKEELLQALAESRSVLIDFSRVEDLDLACLQVIYAARRTSLAEGKSLHLAGSLDGRIAARLAAAGFTAEAAASAEALEAALVDF